MSLASSSAVRAGGFVLVLAVLGAGGFAAGQIIDPQVAAVDTEHDDDGHADVGNGAAEDGGHADAGHGGTTAATDDLPGGLQVSENGYTLVPAPLTYTPGVEQELSLQILGPDGVPVTEFDTTHDKKLHLIVVRRDLSGFQHVHPTMAPDGTWSLPFTFPTAGTYRVFADFQATGEADGVTLGSDVEVAGAFEPVDLPAVTNVAEVDDYEVSLDGDLVPGTASRLTLTIRRNGEPVTDLEPYLAAYGHLVALRAGDLAYLHVHPDGEPGDGRTEPGPSIVFYAEVPTSGAYRLYLDFAHDGVVRTAEFTMTAGAVQPGPTPAQPSEHDDVSDDGHGSEAHG